MAADEQISIEITDKVAPSIQTKLRAIATDSRNAHTAITSLKTALDTLSTVKGLAKLQNELARISGSFRGAADAASKLSAAAARTGLANQKLATELARTQVQIANIETALQRAIAAETKAATAAAQLAAAQVKSAIEAQKLATAQQQTAAAATRAAEALVRLTTAQTNALTAAQRLTTEQQRTAQAQSNAATAATRLQTEQQRLAAATVRVTTEQAKAATAAQRLATEQQRTAVQSANAAAAADRAALAALRLAEAQRQAGSASQGAAGSMANYVKAALAAVGVGIGAGSIIETADAYTILQNKLQNVAASQDQVAEITERLFDIANRTSSSIDSTATAFARFDRSLKGMGKSQEDTLRLTETINKALTVGGASATEASSALLQLSQAFNAGYLMGDEFRSVAENMPMVLDAVSKTLGKPIDQIKKLASEGKITAKVMYDSFKAIEKDVDGTFSKMDMTVAQSRVVFRNYFTKYVGEVDKAYRITATLSSGVVAMARNMDVLAFAASAVAIGLAAAFGPTLVALIARAKLAVMSFNVVLAANPIGAVVVALALATSAIMIFGDEIMVSAERAVTLKDVFKSALGQIKDNFISVGGAISTGWNGIIDAINAKTGGMGERFRDIFGLIQDFSKAAVNLITAMWVGAAGVIWLTWNNFGNTMKGLFTTIVNATSRALSQILNLWQTGYKALAGMVEKISPKLAAGIMSGLDSLKVELPVMDVTEPAKNAAEDIKRTLEDAFSTDYVGKFMDKAEADAKARREAAAKSAESLLRGEGPSQLSTGAGAGGKAAESRATSMAKVNLQLDNELARLNMLAPAREAQAKYDQIEETLLGKKIKLTDQEAASIKAKIAAVQDASAVQAEFDRIYQESVGPAKDYNAAISAADALLKRTAITQEQYNQQVAKSKEAYADAVDPLRQTNIALSQQSELLKLSQPDREVAQQLMQIENTLRAQGLSLLNAETGELTANGEALRKRIELIQKQTQVQQAYDAIYATTRGAQESLTAQVDATNLAYQRGIISSEQYGIRMNSLGVQAANLRIQMGQALDGDVLLASFGAVVEGYSGLLGELTNSFGNLFTSLTDGFANAIAGAIMGTQSLGDALRNVASQAVEQLIASLIKIGIQYAINAAIGQALGTSMTAASVAQAGIVATAWAPAAAAVSLASFGSNSLAAIAGMASANTAAMAFALTGFKTGGYTGDAGINDIAGVVHGKEFVFDAASTSRIGVDKLEAIRAGRDSSPATGGTFSAKGNMGGTKVNLTIVNNANNSKVSQREETDENGNVDLVVTIDSIENALASRMASGRGPLNKATQKTFGLNARPQGR